MKYQLSHSIISLFAQICILVFPAVHAFKEYVQSTSESTMNGMKKLYQRNLFVQPYLPPNLHDLNQADNTADLTSSQIEPTF